MKSKDDLVLTESQWNNILKWIPNNERQQEEERILKYLREASASMKEKWPENNKQKINEIKFENYKNLNPEMKLYEKIKNSSPEERRKMIEEAEKFVSVRKIKECPIELRSAAILSENLQANKFQLEFQQQQKKEEKIKTEIRNKMDKAQSIAWLTDGWQHRTNAYLLAKQHKKELVEMIEQRRAAKEAEKKKRIELELEIIKTQDEEVKEQKAAVKQKKQEMHEYMRQHEKQTNLMSKQNRENKKRENEVIDVLVKVHTEGKNKIKEMIKEQEIQTKMERAKLSMTLQKQQLKRHIEEMKKLEEEQKLIEKARIEKEKILEQKDEKEKERKARLKNERLEDYSQSLKAAEARKAVKKEEDKEYFRARVINDKISQEYSRTRKETKAAKTKEILDNLKLQAIELKKDMKVEKLEAQKAFNKAYDDDTTDEKFFEYAKDLMEEAEKKNRPVKPIIEAMKIYKKRQCIDIKQKTRPHEISNVPIEMKAYESNSNIGKSKRRLKFEEDERKMINVYRGTKFIY
ncbi:hypothetical protein PVAND_009779 [Polypedilum vanderplanki]|uniref:Uncharacterized protein n=1 Tax=Polypedilum vanderplanki TaxID=319348 RepID=A0A9J6CDS9_POLVA|nr:hypothetical protein PVAND_009779 [Polypedilum vanderplanki]